MVATTRPETMLGDTGVAVHPDDERYKVLVGKKVRLPFVDREIPIVADDSVDPEYGSGAVKITPGHDPADYERGQRHSLPIINILEKDGKLNENGGPFAGQVRARRSARSSSRSSTRWACSARSRTSSTTSPPRTAPSRPSSRSSASSGS